MGEDGMDGVEPVEGVMVVVHSQEDAGYQEQRLMVL